MAPFDKLRQNCAKTAPKLRQNCAKTAPKLRQNCAKTAPKLRQTNSELRHAAMSSTKDLLNSIQTSADGLTLAELLAKHSGIARRTAQRLIARLIDGGQIIALGEGRARRYLDAVAPPSRRVLAAKTDHFPSFIPLSADSLDIVAYIDQPLAARKPVGYPRASKQGCRR